MARTKQTQKPKKKTDDNFEEGNQKNNWAVEKSDVTKQDFLDLKTMLFKKKGNELVLRDSNFFTFAAISYFWLDPNDDVTDSPKDCVRVLRVFIQLQNRKYLEDVTEKLGMDDLEEYRYDPLEEDETAIDAKKAFHSVVGNCQNMAFAGVLRTKVIYIYLCNILYKIMCSQSNIRPYFSPII